MKNIPNLSICIVTILFNKAFIPPLSNLENILDAIGGNDIYSIEGYFKDLNTNQNSKMKKIRILHEQKENIFSRILFFLYLQMKMSLEMIRLSKKIDVYIIFMGQGELLPIITAKILRKKVLWLMPSYLPRMIKNNTESSIIVRFLNDTVLYTIKLSLNLVDIIVLYSQNLINEWELKEYKDKIQIAHEHALNFELFKINDKIDERGIVIGFVGRLSQEKGIMNFLESINNLVKEGNNLKFLIIGKGDLKKTVDAFLKDNKLNHKVDLIEWVSHQELPDYLNRLKLLVLPSYTEGLPNIILESMACGTPVLATSVGAINDIIIDQKTGFILDDNDPNNISHNIIRALEYNNIEDVINNSYNLVKNEFSFEKTVYKWKNIFEGLKIE